MNDFSVFNSINCCEILRGYEIARVLKLMKRNDKTTNIQKNQYNNKFTIGMHLVSHVENYQIKREFWQTLTCWPSVIHKNNAVMVLWISSIKVDTETFIQKQSDLKRIYEISKAIESVLSVPVQSFKHWIHITRAIANIFVSINWCGFDFFLVFFSTI